MTVSHSIDTESLYVQLGRLVETLPDLDGPGEYSKDTLMWLARAHALVSNQGDLEDAFAIKRASTNATLYTGTDTNNQGVRKSSAMTIVAALYRALAVAELRAPVAVRAALFPPETSLMHSRQSLRCFRVRRLTC
jgi:hypothetical protein